MLTVVPSSHRLISLIVQMVVIDPRECHLVSGRDSPIIKTHVTVKLEILLRDEEIVDFRWRCKTVE